MKRCSHSMEKSVGSKCPLPTLLLPRCMTLGKLLDLSMPHISYLKNVEDDSPYLSKGCSQLNEIIKTKHAELFLGRYSSRNVSYYYLKKFLCVF